MTAVPPAADLQQEAPGTRPFSGFLLVLGIGGAVGVLVALGLYETKTAYVGLLPVGLALMLPAAFVKDFRLYWFAIFLLSLQFLITKNLNDGLAVIETLKIDYTIWNFTFEVTASDLALLVLLTIWVNDHLFHGRPFRVPPVTWLAVGYLALCLLSALFAASPYLGLVELFRQIKLLVVFLFAVNCLDTKGAMRVLAVVGVVILVTQAAVTIARFMTGYMAPLTFGETYQDLAEVRQYLAVDRTDEESVIRAFGTLASPGSTLKLCMMVMPFALFLCVPNAMFRLRSVFAAATAFALLGLTFTFTRVYYITIAVEGILAILIMVRERMLRRAQVVAIVLLGIAALVAASPKLYEQFTVREDSVTVRLLQYEAAARMILDNPLLGVGLNNGTGEKQRYVDVTLNKLDPTTQFYLEPTHHLYLSLASEIGIFGALLFVAFFATTAVAGWRQSRQSSDPEIRLVANALVVVFCGVAVTGLMDPLQEYPVLTLLWLYAGISLNLSRMTRSQGRGDPLARA
jgi:hypothetical protein